MYQQSNSGSGSADYSQAPPFGRPLSRAEVHERLKNAKTIAVVGLSAKVDAPSFRVARYLEAFYGVIPVNPNLLSWEGRTCYPSLESIPSDVQIDIVDIFRRSDAVLPIVESAVRRGVGMVWMQVGVTNEDARDLAIAAGIPTVMNRCLKVVHAHLIASNP
jgi:uncharacterized protein